MRHQTFTAQILYSSVGIENSQNFIFISTTVNSTAFEGACRLKFLIHMNNYLCRVRQPLVELFPGKTFQHIAIILFWRNSFVIYRKDDEMKKATSFGLKSFTKRIQSKHFSYASYKRYEVRFLCACQFPNVRVGR